MRAFRKFFFCPILLLTLCGFSQDTMLKPTLRWADTNLYRMNVPGYFVLMGKDLKSSFTAPFHLKKRDWVDIGKFAVVIGGLAFTDRPVQRFAQRLRNRDAWAVRFGHSITDFGDTYEAYTLLGLTAFGLITKNQKLKTTGLIASQAAITSGIVGTVIKTLTFRQRPNYYGNANIEPRPHFLGPFPPNGTSGSQQNSSFPSGHTTAAFAAATVFAVQYRNHPIIPVISYTAATMIGLSRITENKHWVTDVTAGAVLGYLTGKMAVRNYERYAAKKTGVQTSFQIQYQNGVLMPGLVVKF